MQYIITKKTDYAKKLKEYERQRQQELNEEAEANALEEQKKLIKFINTEKNIVTSKYGIVRLNENVYFPAIYLLTITLFYSYAKYQRRSIEHFQYGKR